MNVITEQSPHIRRKDSLNRMMLDVIIALSPVIVFALIVYQGAAVRNLLVASATTILAEFLFVLGKTLIIKPKRKEGAPRMGFASFKARFKQNYHLSNILVPLVTGLIFGLLTPATFWSVGADGAIIYNAAAINRNPWSDGYAYLVLTTGALFGIGVGKLIFGGTGRNPLNPAATGFVFCKFVYGARYAVANFSTTAFNWDIATGSTILHANSSLSSISYNGAQGIWDLIIGNTPGLMGETCKIAILIGLVYLLIRHTIDWRVVTSFFGTFIFGLLFVGIIAVSKNPSLNYFEFVCYQLFAGGIIFGGVFMITDPVTMPLTRPNRVLYGMLIAICTLFFRYLVAGGEHYIYEGLAISILICNAIVPLLDYNKWARNVFCLREVLVLCILPIALITIFLLCEAGAQGLLGGGSSSSSSSSSTISTGGSATSSSSTISTGGSVSSSISSSISTGGTV